MNAFSLVARKRHIFLVIILVSTLFFTSCGTSSLTATWHDSSYGGSAILKDVLVIAVAKDVTIKRLYEDSFVEKLADAGAHGVAGYTLNQPDIKPEKEAIEAAVKEAGASSVLITRYLGTDTKEHYRPPQRTSIYADPYYSSIRGYYPMAYREVYTPGYTVTVTTIFLESNLYDAKTGKLVWTARSESINPTMTKKYVNELVNIFFSDLKKNGLL